MCLFLTEISDEETKTFRHRTPSFNVFNRKVQRLNLAKNIDYFETGEIDNFFNNLVAFFATC